MTARRSRPLLVAPLVPLWGAVAFLGAEQARGTAFFVPFVIAMTALLAALFGYIARQTLRAKRFRPRR